MRIILPIVLFITALSLILSSCLDADETLSFEEQLKKDTTEIGTYLRSKNIDALIDVSGVRFVIDSLAPGFPPKNTSTVNFKYVGRFLSGEIFDQGSITGVVDTYVLGFQVGLSLLTEGSKAKFYIPSGLAYGTRGSSGIPPNANLIFEIELTDVVTTQAERQQLASDTVAIDNYLSTNSINAIHDKSGLRYVITQVGTGPKPTLYSKVKISYTGKLLSNGTIFFNGSNSPSSTFDSRVINYLYGFQAALPNMPVGSKATLYMPSGLGFGNESIISGTVTVPANSNLIYDIELVAIVD